MPLTTTKTHDDLVTAQAVAIQASASGLIDFSVGSVLRAIIESTTNVVLWLQGLILVLLGNTRLATSSGADADSWVADYGAAPASGDPTLFARLAASPATGVVTFSRFTPTGLGVVPVGVTVLSHDRTQSFTVTLDTANPAYNVVQNGYTLANGVSSVNVPVAAVTAGAAGNAAPGVVDTLASVIPGIDTCANAAALTGGGDAETDAAMRARFRAFLRSLREGTASALAFYITSIQRGITCKIVENINFDTTSHPGYFYALVDDGTGTPPAAVLTAASLACDAHRAAGIQFSVYAPIVVNANVTMTLVVAASANRPNTVAATVLAVAGYLNTLPIGQPVYYSKLWQVAHEASPDILEITGLTLNGATADLAIGPNQVAKSRTLVVN